MASAPETLIADEWMYDTLRVNATIAAAVGTRIYSDIAPQNATYPCIVYSARPRRDVVALGANRIWELIEYTVRVIAQAEGYSTIQGVADAIDTALNAKSGTTDSATGTVYSCVREVEIHYPSVEDGVPYRFLGGLYQVMAKKA